MNERLEVYDSKMQKTLGNLEGELRAIRAGRANPHILDKLVVDYYGMPTYPTSGERFRSGSSYDSDSTMGKIYGKSNRKSNFNIRYRH